MVIRLEFADSKSASFQWVLRLCRSFPSFRSFEDQDMTIYSVEFRDADLRAFEAIWSKLGAWKNTALYLNGKLITAGDLFDTLAGQGKLVEYQPLKDEGPIKLSDKTAGSLFLSFLKKRGVSGSNN